ncbi:MAG: DUF11 domain-containing protein [Chloroflexus sp.]
MQRRIVALMLLFWVAAFTLPIFSVVNAVELPPSGSPFYIQTSSSSRSLSIGDWYTNTGAGNGFHYFTLHIPCGWDPNNPVHIDLFHPDLNTTAGSGVSDEITSIGVTRFEVYAPGTPLNPPTQPLPNASGSLFQQTYNPNTIGPNWTRLYTISSPVGCGTYILRAETGGTADNSWRLRFGIDDDNDPTTPPPPDYSNPDGLPGTGDELVIGLASTSYQHDAASSPCLTLHQYVTPGQTSVTFHNFDMDSSGSVTYYAPGALIGTAGTRSGNAVWNGGTGTTRGGDTIINPAPGWWRIVTCINNNNQFIQEGQTGVLSFIDPPPQPDMTIAKDDGVDLTAPGQVLTYALTFTNQANLTRDPPGAAFNVTITDTLPPSTTFLSCSLNGWPGSCSHSGGIVTFTLPGPIAAGTSGSVLLTVQVNDDATGTLTNTATLDYRDQLGNPYPQQQASDSNTIPPQPQLVLSKSDGETVTAPGQVLTYTLSFTNTGVGEVRNVILSDTLPAGVSYQSCSLGVLAGTCTASGGVVSFELSDPLAAGASGSVSVSVVVTASGPATLTNTATLTYTDSAGQARPAVTASDETVVPAQPQLVLSKSDGATVTAPGQVLTYTLSFTNTGVGEARNVTLSDTLPAGVSYQSCSLGVLAGTCTASGGVVSFVLSDPLAAGASGSVSVSVVVTASGPATLTNTATLTYTDSAGQARPAVTASDDTFIPGPTGVQVTKQATITVDNNSDGFAGSGDIIEYTVVLTNTGPDTAMLLQLVDNLDPNTTLIVGSVTATPASAVVVRGNNVGDTSVEVTLVSLAVNDNLTVVFRVQVNTPLPSSVTEIVNQATASGSNVSSTPSDDPTTTTPADATRLRTPPPESPPTAITLTEFRLVPVNDGQEIRWTTGAEINTGGFLIYRSLTTRDQAQQLTLIPIPARGSATSSASYSFVDRTVQPGVGYSYWLVEIETTGRLNEYGPLRSYGTISQQHRYYIPLIGR